MAGLSENFGGYLFCHEGLDYVANFDVAVVRDRDAALHAVTYFACVIFEALERADLAFEDDDVVAQQAHFGVALDQAVEHVAAGDGSDFRNAERIAHFGAALVLSLIVGSSRPVMARLISSWSS